MKLVFTLVVASVLSTLIMDIAGGFLRSTGMTAGVPAGLVGEVDRVIYKGNSFFG